MGWWSTVLLISAAVYQCEANILLISNLQVTYYMFEGWSSLKGVDIQSCWPSLKGAS